MPATVFDQLSNGASTVLRLPHVAGDGVLSVQSTTGFVAPTRVVLYTGTGPLSEKRFCILAVTAVNPTTKQLTVSGAVEGTTDVNLKAGVRVEIRGTAGQYNQLAAAINAIETTSVATLSAASPLAYDSGTNTFSLPGSIPESQVTGLVADLAGKAATVHTHTITDTTGLQAALNAKAPTVHTHVIGDVTGLQGALDAKASDSGVVHLTGNETVGGTKTFSAAIVASITGNAATATTAANLSGSIPESQVTGLTDDLGTLTTAVGARLVAANNLGDVANAGTARTNLGLGTAATANTTAFAAAIHAHVIGDVTGLQSALDAKAALVHAHTASDVTDFSEAVDDRVAALLVAGSGVTLTYNDAANTLTVASTGGGGSGSVTSVGLTVPSGLTVSGSPVTGSGTLAVSTTLSGIIKGTGSGFAAAVAGTDYAAASHTHNTDTLTEGSTNLFYTGARFNTSLASKSTSDLAEGSNLYYTNARADARIAAAVGVSVAAFSHTHAASDITSGVLSTARLGSGTPAAGKYVDGGTGAWTTLPTGGGGGGTPAGSDRQIQFNDGGAFGASSGLYYDTGSRLHLTGSTADTIFDVNGYAGGLDLTSPRAIRMNQGYGACFQMFGDSSGTIYSGQAYFDAGSTSSGGIWFRTQAGGNNRLTVINAGPTTIFGESAGTPVLVVKGVTSQAGSLTEWQDSTGSIKAAINKDGNGGIGGDASNAAKLYVQGQVNPGSGPVAGIDCGGLSLWNGPGWDSTLINAYAPSISSVNDPTAAYGLKVGNLQKYYSFGTIGVSYAIFCEGQGIATTNYAGFFKAGDVACIPIVAKGESSQTAPLIDCRDSGGASLTSVSAKGALTLSATLSDSAAPINSFFRGSDHSNSLCWKNASGTVTVIAS